MRSRAEDKIHQFGGRASTRKAQGAGLSPSPCQVIGAVAAFIHPSRLARPTQFPRTMFYEALDGVMECLFPRPPVKPSEVHVATHPKHLEVPKEGQG